MVTGRCQSQSSQALLTWTAGACEAVSVMRPVHGRPTTMAARVHAVASPSSRMMPPSTNCLHWAVEGSGPRRQPGRVLHCRQELRTGAGFETPRAEQPIMCIIKRF